MSLSVLFQYFIFLFFIPLNRCLFCSLSFSLCLFHYLSISPSLFSGYINLFAFVICVYKCLNIYIFVCGFLKEENIFLAYCSIFRSLQLICAHAFYFNKSINDERKYLYFCVLWSSYKNFAEFQYGCLFLGVWVCVCVRNEWTSEREKEWKKKPLFSIFFVQFQHCRNDDWMDENLMLPECVSLFLSISVCVSVFIYIFLPNRIQMLCDSRFDVDFVEKINRTTIEPFNINKFVHR